jgi:phospholipase/lecithinase/hemolysin
MRATKRRVLSATTAILTAAVTATLGTALAALAAPAHATGPTFHRYVALGDSYTAVGTRSSTAVARSAARARP